MLGWRRVCTRAAFRQVSLALILTSCATNNGVSDSSGDTPVQSPKTFGSATLVTAGQYGPLLIDPWDDRVPVIVTFEYTNGGTVVAMRPIDGRHGCNAGAAFGINVYDRLPNRVQLVAYTNRQDNEVSLGFVDHNCNQYGPAIGGAELPSMLYTNPPGYLVKQVENSNPASPAARLLVVDPWNATSKVLASNVTWFAVSDTGDSMLWMFDAGHYKVFDGQQQQLCDVGTAVTEIAYMGNRSGPFFLVDGGILRRYQSTSDTAPIDVASDACQLTKDGNGALYFLSPCKSRQLQRYHLNSRQVTVLDTTTNGLVATRNMPGTLDAYVTYTKPNSQGGQDLWLYSPGAAPTLEVANFNRLIDWTAPPNLEMLAIINADADRGQLIRHRADSDSVLLKSVSVGFSEGVLANFDPVSEVGDLYTVAGVGTEPRFVATGVPYVKGVNTIVASANVATVDEGAAIIANATAGIGDLELIRYPDANSPGPEQPFTLASKSPVGRARFFEGMAAIAYFENWNGGLTDGQGHLAVRELASDVLTDLSDNVREFEEVKWPSEAILYTIWNSDRAGIWIANAE